MAHTHAAQKNKSKLEQAFEVRISSAFTALREDLEVTARGTNTYADEMLGLLGRLEELHLRKHSLSTFILPVFDETTQEKFGDLLSTYSSLVNELAPRRKQVTQAGKEATQAQSAQMRKSRKNIMNAAKRRLDEGREKQQLATDASELMKHYKALIMAT